jgi:hypothetical protein
MSLHPQVLCPIPEETVRVAHAAYPKGFLYLRIRDELGTLYKETIPFRGKLTCYERASNVSAGSHP